MRQCPKLLVQFNLLCCKVSNHEGWGGEEVGFANGVFSDKFPTGVGDLFSFLKFTLEGWCQLDKEVNAGFEFVKDFVRPVLEFGQVNFIILM